MVRLEQHRSGTYGVFTHRYRIGRLVHFERYTRLQTAIARRKHLKHFTRAEK